METVVDLIKKSYPKLGFWYSIKPEKKERLLAQAIIQQQYEIENLKKTVDSLWEQSNPPVFKAGDMVGGYLIKSYRPCYYKGERDWEYIVIKDDGSCDNVSQGKLERIQKFKEANAL